MNPRRLNKVPYKVHYKIGNTRHVKGFPTMDDAKNYLGIIQDLDANAYIKEQFV